MSWWEGARRRPARVKRHAARPSRNRPALHYAPVGARGAGYPAFITATRGKSGVYVIRSSSTHRVLYVGESHKGHLYGTITRHFQAWHRAKRFWTGRSGSPHDPGVTYERGSVEVAVIVLEAGAAIRAQNRLIKRLRARDNVTCADGCPF